MLEQVRAALSGEISLKKDRPIVVGVSGGPDSLCLLHWLHSLGYPLVAAHVNHGLRPEAGEDAAQVQRMAVEWQLPFRLAVEDAARHAKSDSLSIEEAARELRYRFLFKVAEEEGAQAVAVGHTADDQVETVLMHLLRGAGLEGLKGMRPEMMLPTWSASIPLVRPLLSTWREEILDYCEQYGLKPVFDRSNLDTSYFRNRLRHDLLPYLEKYNPQVKRLLWRSAETLAGDHEIVEETVDAAWEKVVLEEEADWVAFARKAFREQPQGVQRRLLRKGIAKLRSVLRDVDFESVERALEHIARAPRSGQADLLAGLRIKVDEERFWLLEWEADMPLGPKWPQLKPDAEIRLGAPDEAELSGRWRLRAEKWDEIKKTDEQVQNNADPYLAWVDAEKVQLPLQVRGRRPGERFRPLGMGGHSLKLSDFFINEKVPQRARDAWPLICSGEQIVWVPGYRLGHEYQLRGESKNALRLCVFREE